MREQSRDIERLRHIANSIAHIEDFLRGKSLDEMKSNVMCYHAVVYNIMVIGEAANLLTKEFREARPQTPWREIVSMRNFIVHGYNVVDKKEVWSVIQDDLQPLKLQIEKYIDEMDSIDKTQKEQ